MTYKENEHLDEQEIIEVLQKRLVKGDTVKVLCQELGINDYTLFGFVKQLKDLNINVSLSNKTDDIFLRINNSPDYTKENFYSIKESIDENTKIGVISDLRFGSKCEQIALLNDMYKKFAEDGVKYVIVAGNLLEGKYGSADYQKYGNSLIINVGEGQADHLIEYYPMVEGIKTLFITGDTDHTWSKELNVGEYIANARDDMIYLGPKACTVKFNNATFRVESLKKTGESYTVSYPPQRYIRSLPSYEDYDFILLGGTLTAQDFPKIRDTRIFAIPSVVARTPKMMAASQQNMMGAYEFELSFDKLGKLKRIVPQLSPYYVPSKENYLTIRPLELTKDEENEFVNHKRVIVEKNILLAKFDKLYRLMKKEEKFSDLKKRLGLSDNELYGIIDVLQQYGRPINISDINGELVVQKRFQKRRHYDVKPPKEELTKRTFGVVSDTHYGSIWSQPSMVNTFAYEAYNRGITDMFHIGDISDGDYHTIRPNYVNEVFLYGATAHGDYAAKVLPKYPGMMWRYICGSHDQSHSFNYGPFNFGEYLHEKRPNDTEYLGQDRGFYYYDKCKIELFHPGGGTCKTLSTKPQNGIDQMESGTKPNLSLRGHYHKVYYMMYRNIHTLLCPCNVDQSSFMMKNEIPNLMGDYFITIWYDDNGDIQYIETEPMIFDQSDVRRNDWENPTRYMKNKIYTKKCL